MNEGRKDNECAHGSFLYRCRLQNFAMNQVIFQQIDVDTELYSCRSSNYSDINGTLWEYAKDKINKVGYGLGSRETGYPNVLRVYEEFRKNSM